MASDVTRWPWKIDAATFPAEFAGGVITTQRMAPGVVSWTSTTSGAGDVVVLSDLDGHEVWRSLPATGANFGDDHKYPDSVHFRGLKVTTLLSGFVYWEFR